MTDVDPLRIDVPADVPARGAAPTWGSDLIVSVLRALGVEYVSVVPGSTTRGIHDSIVNFAGNTAPSLILCNHEMSTVSVARGYARASGRPMAALLHNVVGLLNAEMTIYDAWCDRAPVLLLGGTGPMASDRRRPGIDWLHTANLQGNLVRDFTKWDDQPASLGAVVPSLLRAYRTAVAAPQGPVYVSLDVEFQDQRLTEAEAESLPDVRRYAPARPPAPDPEAVRELAGWLVAADLPVVVTTRLGRSADAVEALVELADLLAAPVVNMGEQHSGRHSFPTHHPLDFANQKRMRVLPDADVVLGLDAYDLAGAMRTDADRTTRRSRELGATAKVASISLDELLLRGWALDHQRLPEVDLPLLADATLATPMLLEECRRLLDDPARSRVEVRRRALEKIQAEARAGQQRYVEAQCAAAGISEARMICELWEAIRSEEFVLTAAGRIQRMAPGVVDVRGPAQFVGCGAGGGAVGASPGVALGAALALRGSGALPVAVLGDGNLLAAIHLLWTAAHYQIPSLWIVNNNRSYFQDEDHQERMAEFRGRPAANRWIGQRMENPTVDFAAIARTLGLPGEGPVTTPAELRAALRRGVAAVKRGEFVVVDVWTTNRPRKRPV